MSASAWPPAPEQVRVEPGEVHVWRSGTELDAPALSELAGLLDDSERARAERLRVPAGRRRFVVAHAVARLALSGATGVPAAGLRFERRCAVCGADEHGKPFVTGDGAGVEFSLSHSAGRVLVAVAPDRPVGVDVEAIRADADIDSLAHRFFAPAEVAALARLDAKGRRSGFFELWAAKEAYLKARGEGLAGGLAHFALTPGDGAAYRLEAAAGDEEEWRVLRLDPGPESAGAIAATGSDWQPRTWHLDLSAG